MAGTKEPSHKHFRLDSGKIRRVQRVLGTPTETEAVDRALDFVLAEHKTNRLLHAAHERFFSSGVEIKDVYGTLEP